MEYDQVADDEVVMDMGLEETAESKM